MRLQPLLNKIPRTNKLWRVISVGSNQYNPLHSSHTQTVKLSSQQFNHLRHHHHRHNDIHLLRHNIHHRAFSSSAFRNSRQIFLPGNIVQSPTEDLELPENATLHDIIFEKCDHYKDFPALTDFVGGKSYTYSEVKDKAIRVASALSRRGYKKGDVILCVSTNHVDFTVLQLAASSLGCWFSGANPAYTPEELARQIEHGECKAVFALDSLAKNVVEALKNNNFTNQVKELFVFGEHPDMVPFDTLLNDNGDAFPTVEFNTKEDVCVLPYSSGTTGFPKGVMLTHHNIVVNLLQCDAHNVINHKDNVVGLLPLFHAYAQLVTQFATLYNGATVHYLTHFEPQSFLSCMQDRQINYANIVPPLVLFLTNHPIVNNYDLTKLKIATCAAAPLGKELTENFAKKFPYISLRQGYGLTEASPGITFDKEQSIGSVGPLLPNTFAKIIDLETGESLGPNKEGELCAWGPQVMKGYFKNKEATDEMIKPDGWMHTGDVGYYDETGMFYISDRLKELIKYKGFQVAPAELESLLVGHPDIQDVCVIGVPDDKCGEVPKAFVVKMPNSEITEEDIIKFVEENVSTSKRLRGGVEFINEIPKSSSGKILRRLLRQ